MYEAYECSQLLKLSVHIECIAAYGESWNSNPHTPNVYVVCLLEFEGDS